MQSENENKDRLDSASWTKQFREAAILRHHGDFLGIDEISKAGMDKYSALVRGRESDGPDGKDFLIPLLEDSDPSVRVVAAAYLLKRREDIALPVLLEIEENCVTEAFITASSVVMIHSLGKWSL